MRERWRSLLVFDPGLGRTLLAGRVTVSVAVALAAATLLVRAAGMPSTAAMLAAMAAMQTVLAIFGPTGAPRLRAVAVAWVVACAAIGAALVVTPSVLARSAGFVVVMAVAVWVRRFAPAGFGLGMMGFNAFFFTVFVRASPSQLPG